MPSMPASAARRASSTCWMPLSTIGPSQCSRRKGSWSQRWSVPVNIGTQRSTAAAGSSSGDFASPARKAGSENGIAVPTPRMNGR